MENYINIQIILTVVNIISLILFVIGYFKGKYTIVDLETWNNIVTYYNEHIEAENDNCGGGIGFFWDYANEEINDDEDKG